jgi:hypothetical protein
MILINTSSPHDCTLEAMRTQGRFSFFQGVAAATE